MGKLKYSKFNYSLQYNPAEAHAILANFIERYVDEEKLKQYILMWNSFIYKRTKMS